MKKHVIKFGRGTGDYREQIRYRDNMIKWLNDEVGVMQWNWGTFPSIPSSVLLTAIHFKYEEDKVKFILRWM